MTMVFHFVTACAASTVLTAVLTVAASRDRRNGWVRRRSESVGELMADWAAAQSLPLPDANISDSVVRRQPVMSLTSDLMALEKTLGRVNVRAAAPDGAAARQEQATQPPVRA